MIAGAPAADRDLELRSIRGAAVVGVAAAAMVATLPGRTHGLGMITERLLADPAFGMNRTDYAELNLWATLAGALFCLPCGWLIDRYGIRRTLVSVVLALSLTVLAMTQLRGFAPLFAAVMFTRGFGQSALSVVSITIVGKCFARRHGPAMGAYSVLVSVGFSIAFGAAKHFADSDWRVVWGAQGIVLACVMAPLGWLLLRDLPPVAGRQSNSAAAAIDEPGFTLAGALRTPAFWVFGIASSTYGLIAAGISLFNESILVERGFEKTLFYDATMITVAVSLASNLLCGRLIGRVPVGRLMAVAMAVLATSLYCLPQATARWHVVLYACGMGVAGGMVTVLYFAIWAHAFGRPHLGRIQGVAQMLTVFASAVGPLLLAECQERLGSYVPMFRGLAVAVAVLSFAALVVRVPRPADAPRFEPAPSPELASARVEPLPPR